LVEFWDQIRSYGFTTKNIIPRGLEEYSDYLITLFLNMNYCGIVKISEDDKSLDSKDKYGLQWVPPVMDENLFNVNQRANLK
jgi:hypothetical protein